jgi:hypothetical protein
MNNVFASDLFRAALYPFWRSSKGHLCVLCFLAALLNGNKNRAVAVLIVARNNRKTGRCSHTRNKLSFEEAVLPHRVAAYNLARWLTRNEADAHDVVQEAFLRAFKVSTVFVAMMDAPGSEPSSETQVTHWDAAQSFTRGRKRLLALTNHKYTEVRS